MEEAIARPLTIQSHGAIRPGLTHNGLATRVACESSVIIL